MSRAGIAAGLTGLLAVALAVGPVSPSQATRAPSVGARIVAAGTPAEPLLRAKAPNPSVTKLTPQSGPTTGGLDVVIKGDNLSGVKKVFFGATKATKVRVKSARKVVVQAPPHEAGLVRVRVVTKHGGSKQNEATKFTYLTPAPALSQLSPRTGPTAGGTTVTLTGSNLSGATSVRFGSTGATSFRVTSPTTITAVSPGRPTGPVNVTVTTAGGAATLDDAFSYVPAPMLSFVDPGSGPLVATPVTLVGTALTADARVTFGGVLTPVLSAAPNGTELTVNSPAHAPGFVDVVVTTTGGSSTLVNGYRYVAGTTLTAVTPSAGPSSGGETVTLTGTGFTGDTLVTFGNKPSFEVFANLSGTQLTALLPSHAAGTVDVSVATEGGSATLTNGFTYVDAPTLTSITPVVGPVAGGTPVTLAGTNFRAGMQVRFGGVLAPLGSINPGGTSATVTTPAHAAGAVDVSVTTPGGTATLPGSFTYVAVPSLATVSPNEGPTAGGQTVTLTGANFRAGMQVSFGSTAATGLVVVSPTEATVVTPAHAVGAVGVTVTTPGGTSTPSTYTYVVLPVLVSVTPDNGPVGGGTTVTLAGSGFRSGMQVRFDGALAFLVSVNPGGTSAVVINPTHPAGTVDVTVSTPGGTETRSNGFTYVAVPELTAVSPDEGPTTGGQTATLTGTGFRAGMQVSFGGALATGLNVVSATQATVTTPGHAAGVVDMSVSTSGGSFTLPGGYTFVIAPTLTAVAPDEGPSAGGQTVTLSGTGFRAGMQVRLGGDLAVLVSVNPGGTSATVTSPPHAAGVVGVSVTTPGGAFTLGNGYTYVAPPTVTAVAPAEGSTVGGQSVTLTGTGFRPGMQVLFDGDLAVLVSVNPGGTSATVTSPPHAAGAVNVSVTTPGGSATLTNGYTYVVAPTVTAVAPDVGPAAGGQTVMLSGTGFRPGMQVSLGGGPAAIVSINPGGTSLTATTPAHAAGIVDVEVTTPGGSDTLDDSYTFVDAPGLVSISPDEGPAAGGTPVTITGTDLTGTTEVTFDGIQASFLVVNDTTLTATTPVHAAGLVTVSVITPGGADTIAFTYVAAPTLSLVSPDNGPATGLTSVTLTGTGLTGTTDVTFDGLSATNVVVVSDTEVTVDTPAHAAGLVDVEVTTPGGADTLLNAFTYLAAPTLTVITPDNGPATGLTSVTLTGTGLTGTADVTFDGLSATNVVVVSDTEVTVDTPAHAAGLVDVEVTTPGGSATLDDAYTYTP